jgi:beta-glucanase (GH16 family)
MKSILVKFRERTFKNIALISLISVFLVACGGQDSVDPNSNDTNGPDISLNFKDGHSPVAVIQTKTGLEYIPNSKISYQDSETIMHNFGSYSLKYVKGPGESWAGVWLELDAPIDPSKGEIITAKIHSVVPRNITLKLDVADIERTVAHSGDGHEVLNFDFSGEMPSGQIKLSIFNDLAQQGTGNANWTIYIDDITQKPGSEALDTTKTILVDFDNVTNKHIFGDFNGATASVEEAPDSPTDLQVNGTIIGYHETHNLGLEFEYLGAEASDAYSGYIPNESIVKVSSAPTPDGELIDIHNPNDQEITYIATDKSENVSELKRFISMIDVTKPSIIFNGDKDLIVSLGSTFTDSGATGSDNIPNNIDETKNKTVIKRVIPSSTGDGYDAEVVSEITTNEVAHYKIEYSFTDNSGNEGTSTRNVFIRNPYNDSQAVFENGAVDAVWLSGIAAYDQGIPGYGSCKVGYGCPNLKWETLADGAPGRGNVLQITHLDNDFDAGLYISSPNGNDLRGSEETGLLQLDIKRASGSDPYVDIWADCGYPCAGGPSRQGPFVTGEWTRIYIPIKDILVGPTSRLDLQIVKAGLLFKAASAKDAIYRIDNVVWLCETTCEGNTTDHVPFNWSATHEDPSKGSEAQTSYDGYTLVWSDEFNGNIVNPANWDFDLGNGEDGWGNGELQHYREENATVDNGLLAIEAKKHQPKLTGDIGYTSAKLVTEDLFEFKYGRVDARAVAAKGQGLWSAIWMLGANHSEVGWPRSGEIDILDTIAGNRDGFPQEAMLVNNMYWNAEGSSPDAPYSLGSINQNGSAEYWLNEPTDETDPDYTRPLQWDVDNLPDWMAGPTLDNPATEEIEEIRPLLLTGCEGSSCYDTDVIPTVHKTPVDVDNLPNWITEDSSWINWKNDGGSVETFSNTFHVFSLIWTEDKIIFEVDGEKTNEIDIKGALVEHYRQTFYLILNVAVGGNWPKAPEETTAFSDGMLVDYVRVYQADSDGDGTADLDWDGETILDVFPNNPEEWFDTDSDNIGNEADNDDDGDGILDSNDEFPLDTDNDGTPNVLDSAPNDPLIN